MKSLFLLLALPLAAHADFNGCRDIFPNSTPPVLTASAPAQQRALCFTSFAVMHSGVTKTPVYVVQRMSAKTVAKAKGEERRNRFYEEGRLPKDERATLADYEGRQYDRGHMAPAGDMPDPSSMAQSFSLANMVPQAPSINRGPWKKIELDTRKYVSRAEGYVYVYTGPIYSGEPVKAGNVLVPTSTFKLVFDQMTGKSWAFVVHNTAGAKIERPITHDELVKLTSAVKAFLP